jgi:hypothetical protein
MPSYRRTAEYIPLSSLLLSATLSNLFSNKRKNDRSTLPELVLLDHFCRTAFCNPNGYNAISIFAAGDPSNGLSKVADPGELPVCGLFLLRLTSRRVPREIGV